MTTVVTRDGVELAVTVTGPEDAPVAAVLIHGWCLSSEIYRYQPPVLAQHPVRVVTYDARGHGRSGPAPRGSMTIAQVAEDLRTVLEQVCGDLPVVLVGHSLGGMTIMALAESDPSLFAERIAGVVFVNTAAGDLAGGTLGLPGRLSELIRRRLPRELGRRRRAHLRRGDGPVRRRLTDAAIARYILFGRGPAREDVRLGRRLICTTHPAVVEGFYHDLIRHNRHKALRRLADVPVRVLAGGADRLTPVVHSRRIAAAMPSARLSIYPGAGHMIPLERPDELAAEVLQLVHRITAPNPRRITPTPRRS